MDSVKSQCAKLKGNKEHAEHSKRTKRTQYTKRVKTEKSLLILTASGCSEPVRDFARRQAEESGAREDGAQWLGVPLNIGEFSAALGANNVQMIALPVRSGLTDRIRALLGEQGVSAGPARLSELECLQKFEDCERPGDVKEAENGRLISLPEGGVALEQNESV
jgi:hypothetical protein